MIHVDRCLKFIFSVVDDANTGDWSRDVAATYERFLRPESRDSEGESNEGSDKEDRMTLRKREEKKRKVKKENDT